ncbi:MAG: TolC family protein [Bacteroidota bacterium]
MKRQADLRWVMLLLFILGWQGLTAQQAILDQYVQEGLENNLALKRQDMSYEKSLQALKEAKGLFLPGVSFNASYTLANGGRAIDFPIGDLLNPIYGTLNQLTESQSFPSDLPNESIQFLPNNFHETKTVVSQPLFNTDIYYNYKAKTALTEVEKASKEVFQLQLVRDIQVAYLGYLQTLEGLEIFRETAILLDEVKRVNKKLVASQKSTREVISQTDFQISDIAQQEASIKQKEDAAKAYFNFLLNRPLDAPIQIDSSLISDRQLGNLDELTSEALQKRPEFTQLDKAQEANQFAVKRYQYANLPKLGVGLELGFQGFGYNFGDNQAYYLAGFSLNWDLFKGGQNKAAKQQALLDQQMLVNQEEELRQQIALQLRQNYFAAEAAKAKEGSARDGLASARQSFHIINKKYQNQQASFLDYLQAQTNMTTARLNLSSSHYEYLTKLAELAYAAGKSL